MGDVENNGLFAASCRRLLAGSLVLLATACSSGKSTEPVAAAAPSGTPASTPTAVVPAGPPEPPVDVAGPFPVSAFADFRAQPVSAELAQELQAAIEESSERLAGAGISATVLSPSGTWSGSVGKADTRRSVGITDTFAIASVTKTLQAAQVMRLVEAGSLRLDDRADKHLPADLDFDTNGATIRQLMGMRSGIPDYWPELEASLHNERRRVWTTAELLALTPAERSPAGTTQIYADTNYLLLELVIEHVTGRTVVEVMRDGGVLDIEGVEGLAYQPDERPAAPMAMPHAMSPAKWRKGGGQLPSIASTTAYHQFATDSQSLARWWQAFCSGEIVSRRSLTTMADLVDGYGLGLFDLTAPYATSFGHAGSDVGFIAWAGCLPDSGSVVVTLSNTGTEDIGLPEALVRAVESGVDTGSGS